MHIISTKKQSNYGTLYVVAAQDLGIEEAVFSKNLLFTDKKIGETMTIAMKESDAVTWFNAVPPDLSLTARSKGADYIYYLLLYTSKIAHFLLMLNKICYLLLPKI